MTPRHRKFTSRQITRLQTAGFEILGEVVALLQEQTITGDLIIFAVMRRKQDGGLQIGLLHNDADTIAPAIELPGELMLDQFLRLLVDDGNADRD